MSCIPVTLCNIEQSAEVQKTELLGRMFNILRGNAWNILQSCCGLYHYYACIHRGTQPIFLFTAKAPESRDGCNFGGPPKQGLHRYRPCVVWKYTQAATDSLALTATTNDLPSLRKLGRMLEAKNEGSWWSVPGGKKFVEQVGGTW